MGLKLVTGPANSGRAGEVLGAYRARIADDPILVVPALRDVSQLQRELARTGGTLGAGVARLGRPARLHPCGAAAGGGARALDGLAAGVRAGGRDLAPSRLARGPA